MSPTRSFSNTFQPFPIVSVFHAISPFSFSVGFHNSPKFSVNCHPWTDVGRTRSSGKFFDRVTLKKEIALERISMASSICGATFCYLSIWSFGFTVSRICSAGTPESLCISDEHCAQMPNLSQRLRKLESLSAGNSWHPLHYTVQMVFILADPDAQKSDIPCRSQCSLQLLQYLLVCCLVTSRHKFPGSLLIILQ